MFDDLFITNFYLTIQTVISNFLSQHCAAMDSNCRTWLAVMQAPSASMTAYGNPLLIAASCVTAVALLAGVQLKAPMLTNPSKAPSSREVK